MNSSNKVALVTGGARRLGKHISLSLAESGYDIVLNYNESGKLISEKILKNLSEFNVNVTAVKCDLTKVKEIKKMFSVVSLKYGKLDLLVNNAAVFKKSDFFETTEKMYDNFLDTNLKGMFFCCQEAAKIMLKSENKISRIINIASLGAIENWTGYIPYSLAKTGVIKLTSQLGKKLAPEIIVNAIAPGTIEMEDEVNADKENINKYPMKKFADTGDILSLVKYLALENKYITGQTFIVDGGKSL
ncbi:MAG TPA: SDR family oxidoreductase [Ignavibacteria bacterium]|nr:SDR family oxidoreductase [Ignavibacteria bacterium]